MFNNNYLYMYPIIIQNNTRGLGKKRSACSGTASNCKRTTAPSKKKKANSTSAASRVSLFHEYYNTIHHYLRGCVHIDSKNFTRPSK